MRRSTIAKSKSLIPAILLVVGVAFSSGCAYSLGPAYGQNSGDFEYGYVYRRVRTPFTLDLDKTPVVKQRGEGKVVHIEEPFTQAGLYAEFNSNAIADIAKKHGMKKVYFADLESFSVLGVFRHQKLILYGE